MRNPLHAARDAAATVAPFLLAAMLASAAVGGLSAVMVGCASPGRDQVQLHAPELIERFDQLMRESERLAQEIPLLEQAAIDAVASPDPSDDLPAAEALAAANTQLAQVEAELAPIEERVHRGQAKPITDGLGALHPLLGAAAMAAVPLLGSRGRKLFTSALRKGARGQLLTAAGDILKMLGAQHSGLNQPPQPPQPPADEQPKG